jgi:hypothetical protein
MPNAEGRASRQSFGISLSATTTFQRPVPPASRHSTLGIAAFS